MPEWGNPSWRDQGRTGPNGPRYAKRSDRAAVRRGGSPGDGKGCCFAGQAVKSALSGKFRLARRFIRLDIKTRLGAI